MISLNDFINLPEIERRKYFQTAAAKLGLSELVIEKDFWVSFILQLLFSNKELSPHLTFKGGTSLSKGFHITRRFSEDVDVTIEKELFGFMGENRPENSPSSNKEKKLIEQLKLAAKTYVGETILNSMRTQIASCMSPSQTWALELDQEDHDGQTLLFHFPNNQSKSKNYISPAVKIEFGAKGEHWPVENYQLSSYLHEALDDSVSPFDANVRVLSPKRTIWEKATILHSLSNYPEGKTIPIRQSRHFYDFYCLINSIHWQDALKDLKLLEDVCHHKMVYFRSAAARYQDVLDGQIKLLPSSNVVRSLKEDYESMEEMLFDKPIDWDEIIQTIMTAEKEINSLIKRK